MPDRFLAQVAVMAVVTYLVRVIPLALCRGQLKSRWVRDFLSVFSSTGSPLSALCGVAVGVALSWMEKGLVTVALAACAAVFLAERLL